MDMGRTKVKLTLIADGEARKTAYEKRMQELMKKAEELTNLCNMSACLIFFSRDDDKMVVWPAQEEAKSLIDRFYEIPENERKMNAEDLESIIKTNIKKMEEKLDHTRKAIKELEMDHLMSQIQNGRSLYDLSQTEFDNLMSHVRKKITGLRRRLGYTEHPYTSVNEPILGDDIPKASDVAPEGEPSFRPMGSGSVSLMDKWFFPDPKVPKHGDETHLTTKSSRFDLNMEPSDEDDEMKTYEGEGSKSGGADDA